MKTKLTSQNMFTDYIRIISQKNHHQRLKSPVNHHVIMINHNEPPIKSLSILISRIAIITIVHHSYS